MAIARRSTRFREGQLCVSARCAFPALEHPSFTRRMIARSSASSHTKSRRGFTGRIDERVLRRWTESLACELLDHGEQTGFEEIIRNGEFFTVNSARQKLLKITKPRNARDAFLVVGWRTGDR